MSCPQLTIRNQRVSLQGLFSPHHTLCLVDYNTLYKYGDLLLLALWKILPNELQFVLMIVGSN